jgi:hypothetical protein
MNDREDNDHEFVAPRGAGRAFRIAFSIFVVSLIAMAAIPSNMAAQSDVSEYRVKAAFMFQFAQFVTWPEDAFKDAASPINFCTLGTDPFGGALEAALDGKSVGAHPAHVVHLKQRQEASICHMLFVGADNANRLAAVLQSLQSSPVVTVGDIDRFAQQGGMIGLVLENNKVRFEINLDAADRGRVKFNARLITLAKNLISTPKSSGK